MRGLNALVNLKTLDLSHNQITQITGIRTLQNLDNLSLGHNLLSDFDSIQELQYNKQLEYISKYIFQTDFG